MEKLLTIKELSEILGVRKSTLYSGTSKKRIPYVKLSEGVLRFRGSEIQEWILKRAVLSFLKR
jgi:excisionase family DNA binding protein